MSSAGCPRCGIIRTRENCWGPEMTESNPFSQVEFVENPEPRCPCVLLLDVSGSMSGDPIAQLNAGIQTYLDELLGDVIARQRVEVAIVTFGQQVKVDQEFATADHIHAPTLTASGTTPMGSAINQALDLLQARKEQYRANGVMYYRPWVFLLTDGAPTDEWKTAATRVAEGEEKRQFMFFSVGVEGANFDVLKDLSTRDPLKLKGIRFRDLFLWLSASQKCVSRSQPGETVKLTPPEGPQGWAEVSV